MKSINGMSILQYAQDTLSLSTDAESGREDRMEENDLFKLEIVNDDRGLLPNLGF